MGNMVLADRRLRSNIPTETNVTYTIKATTNLTNEFGAITNFPGDGLTNSVPISPDALQKFYKALEAGI